MAIPVRRAKSPILIFGAMTTTIVLGGAALPAGATTTSTGPTTTSTTPTSTTTSPANGTTPTTTGPTTTGASTTVPGPSTTVPGPTPTTTTTTAPASTTSTTVPALEPSQLLSSALAAAASERAVKWTEKVTMSGVTINLQASSGKVDGLRTETISDGTEPGQISTILDGGVAYVRGNFLGLRAFMDFTTSAATTEAGHWVFAERSKPAQALVYYSMASGLTVSSMVAQLLMLGKVTMAPLRVVHGQSVYGVKGNKADDTSVPEVLYVRSTGSHLPVEMTSSYKGVNATVVFGTWGRPPSVSVPAQAVPMITSWMTAAAG